MRLFPQSLWYSLNYNLLLEFVTNSNTFLWEATPGFVRKWAWVLENCHQLIDSTNRWRAKRDEKPLDPLPPWSPAILPKPENLK